jgi:adenylylsulfate kinase-like enzyme
MTSSVLGVLLISGVPGAGKTTVSRIIVRKLERSALIQGDEIHDLVVAGRKYQAEGPSDEVERQMRLRDRNVSLLVDNLAEEGFLPIVDDVIIYPPRLQRLLASIRTRPVFMAVLAPSLAVLERRDRDRPDKHVFQRWSHLHDDMRRDMAGIGVWVDSTKQTPEATATEVMARVWKEGLIAG